MMALAWPDNMIAFPQPQGKSNEWYTPARYIEAAREVMGSIDLDPASCEMANRTVKAKRYYTQAENGLIQPWYGNVWLNPPWKKTKHGRSSIAPFVAKALQNYQEEAINQCTICLPASTDTRWFIPLWDYSICFPPYRIDFTIPGLPPGQPPFGICFVYFGPNEQLFIDVFSQFGTIAKRVSPPRHTIAAPSLWEVQP